MLIDVGTNGEIVVGNKEWLVCCSASAGPAFEGGSVKYGMRAGLGAIERVEIADGGGSVKLGTVGNEKPRGICGSGLIDTIAELLGAGVIDRAGNFVKGTGGNRLRGTDSGFEGTTSLYYTRITMTLWEPEEDSAVPAAAYWSCVVLVVCLTSASMIRLRKRHSR